VFAPLRRSAWATGTIVALLVVGAGLALGLLWRRTTIESLERQLAAERARARAEESIARTRVLLQEVGSIAAIGAWELDVATMKQEWTDETYVIHDRQRGVYDPDSAEELSRFEPGSRERMEEGLRQALAEGRPYDLEVEMTTVKGNRKWVRAVCMPIVRDGKVVTLRGTVQDISVRKRVEEELRLKQNELLLRNRIAEVFLTVADDMMYDRVLVILIEAFASRYGVFGYIDENGALVVPTMTRHIWDKCQMPQKTIVFPRQQWGDSIWPRAIRERRILFSNEPSALTPAGHITVTRNISAPIIHRGEVVGLFQVANKETD